MVELTSLNRGEGIAAGFLGMVVGELRWWKDERGHAKLNHDGVDGTFKLCSPLKDNVQYEHLSLRELAYVIGEYVDEEYILIDQSKSRFKIYSQCILRSHKPTPTVCKSNSKVKTCILL